MSDLVKAFIDTESEIQSSLNQLGFTKDNDDNNNVSGSHEEILSSLEDGDKTLAMTSGPSPRPALGAAGGGGALQLGEGGGDFCDDGPDLITSFLISGGTDGSPDSTTVNIDDDVVLGASRRLRAAVDRILHLLKNVAALQYEASGGRSSADSSVQTVIGPNGECSNCERKKETIRKMEKEFLNAERTNRVLQEELNSKHLQLSALKSRIDNTSILDAQTLKDKNEELKRQLRERESLITRLRETVDAMQSGSSFTKNITPQSRLSIEVGRDATASLSLLEEPDSVFFKSHDLYDLKEDDFGSLSPVKLDDIIADRKRKMVHISCAEGGDGKRDSDDSRSISSNAELASLFQKIIDEKNQEIDLLRQQMKLAQDMIATAFPNQTTDHDLLDVDLIEALVESHLKKKSTVNVKTSTSGLTGLDLIPEAGGPKSPDSAVPSAASDSGSVSSSCINEGNETSFFTVEQLDGRLNQLYSVVENLMRTNNRIQNQQQQLKRDKEEAEKKYTELLKSTQTSRSHIERLESDNKSLRETLSKNEQHRQDLKKKTDAEMNHQISLLQSSVRVKDEEIESLQERIHSLIHRLDIVNEEVQRQKVVEKKEEEELKTQIRQLKCYSNEQQKQISGYETRVQSLLTKIEELKLELDTSSLNERKIKDLEFQLKTANDIIAIKKGKISQLMDTLTKMSQHNTVLANSPATALQMKVLVKKLKKAQHEKRALIFQKNYLANVLSGFQVTERATLALLGSMNCEIAPDSCMVLSPLRRFKSAVFAVMSIRRMKLLVQKWSFRTSQTSVKAVNDSPSYQRKTSLSSSTSSSSSSSFKDTRQLRAKSLEKHQQRTNESMEDFMARLREIHETLGLNHSLSEPDGFSFK